MQGSTEVGARIRTARKRAHISQESVAEKLGMEQATISKIERGKIDARSSAIAVIAEMCGVSTDWILFGRGDGPVVEPLAEGDDGEPEKGAAA